MKLAGGKSPNADITRSPSPAVTSEGDQSVTMIESSSRNEQAALRADCLRRDGNRCVLTHYMDADAFDKLSPDCRLGVLECFTECAHILPFSLGKFNGMSARETENTAAIWVALHRYFPCLVDKIHADSVNQRGNAITLTMQHHRLFGTFGIALEPTGEVGLQPMYCTSRNCF